MPHARSAETHTVAQAIYGTILVTALVAGLSVDEDVAAWQILVSVVATMVVFWVAHAYAEVLSQRLAARRRLSWAETGRALAEEVSMLQAGAPAALALALAALQFYSVETGVTLAIGAGVASLVGYGLLLGYRERAGVAQTLASGALNGAFGLVIVALKAFIH